MLKKMPTLRLDLVLAALVFGSLRPGLIAIGPEQPLVPLVPVFDILHAQEHETAKERNRKQQGERRLVLAAERTAQAIVRLLKISTHVFSAEVPCRGTGGRR